MPEQPPAAGERGLELGHVLPPSVSPGWSRGLHRAPRRAQGCHTVCASYLGAGSDELLAVVTPTQQPPPSGNPTELERRRCGSHSKTCSGHGMRGVRWDKEALEWEEVQAWRAERVRLLSLHLLLPADGLQLASVTHAIPQADETLGEALVYVTAALAHGSCLQWR